MRSVTVKNIHKGFNSKEVLAGVSFAFSEGRRLALVGENGGGKSTLLKILTGRMKADSGEILGLDNDCAYVSQDFTGKDSETPLNFLTRRSPSLPKAIRMLADSGFEIGKDGQRLSDVHCGDLSGGEKKKLEIAVGLANGSRFIVLDEPENHLDYQTIEWLVAVLSEFRGGLMFVSHDQYLVDQLSDTVLELEGGHITVYSMKYGEYLDEKNRQVSGKTRNWIAEKKAIERLRCSLEMMKLRAKRNSDTAATYQQAKRRLAVRIDSHGKNPSHTGGSPKVSLSRGIDQKRGKLIASIDRMSFGYGSKSVFYEASAELRFGEKVVLFGRNGSGKSTLVKLITGELKPQTGTARMGPQIQWQFMTQDHLANLDTQSTPLDVFVGVVRWTESRSRSCLAQYGIGADIVRNPLWTLSGGQQARFKLALIFAQDPEFLILDEPTNHVDPMTWEAVVEAVKGYSGTVLAVTHDREFVDAIAGRLWVMENRKITVYDGNLSEYLQG